MKITKFQIYDRTRGKCGTIWVKETNPYWEYYKQVFQTLKEVNK